MPECRRQWIQDTRAHTKQMQSSIESVEQGFTAVAIPGNAELQGEVDESGHHQQLTLAQQDMALDKIQAAAARVADLGLGMMHELRVQHRLAVTPPCRLAPAIHHHSQCARLSPCAVPEAKAPVLSTYTIPSSQAVRLCRNKNP